MLITSQELIELRNNLGISQERLSIGTGISTFRIGQFERGIKELQEVELTQIQGYLFETAKMLRNAKVFRHMEVGDE